MTDLIINWALTHRQYLEGIALGYAAAHVPWIVYFLFHQIIRVPILRQAILSNPEESKKVIDEVSSELKKDIDQEAQSSSSSKPPDSSSGSTA